MKNDRPIAASELGEFVYCQRSWWLKMVCKQEPNEQARVAQAEGEVWHLLKGRRIARTSSLRAAGYAAILAAGMLLILWMWGMLR